MRLGREARHVAYPAPMILAASMGPTPKISVRVVPEASISTSMRQFRSAIFRSSVLTSRSTSEANRRRRRAEAPPRSRMPRRMRGPSWPRASRPPRRGGGPAKARADGLAPPKARSRSGADEVGQGVGEGRCSARLAEAHATARFCRVAEKEGGRADAIMDRPKQEDEQGLREDVCERRGLR